MDIVNVGSSTKIAVICCMHGNEIFGKTVFDYFKDRIHDYPSVGLIFANQSAYDRALRYIDKDLNTVFPGNATGNHEQRLAVRMLSVVRDVDIVLDIHTTSSDVGMVPIIANLDERVKRVINATSRTDVVLMGPRIVAPSLIGSVRCGVSLEFNEAYATTDPALEEVAEIVNALVNHEYKQPMPRRVFRCIKTIPLGFSFDAPVANLQKQPNHGFYPFLFDEKSNEHDQGFAALNYSTYIL